MLKKIILFSLPFTAFYAGIIFEKNRIKNSTKYFGTIRVDHSEDDEPEKLFLELESSIDNLEDSKIVMFKVLRENYISHK